MITRNTTSLWGEKWVLVMTFKLTLVHWELIILHITAKRISALSLCECNSEIRSSQGIGEASLGFPPWLIGLLVLQPSPLQIFTLVFIYITLFMEVQFVCLFITIMVEKTWKKVTFFGYSFKSQLPERTLESLLTQRTRTVLERFFFFRRHIKGSEILLKW